MTLGELATRLGCVLEGEDVDVARVAKIDQAGPGDLTFLANIKYSAALTTTGASAVILAPGVQGAPCAVLRSGNPYLSFARAAALLAPDVRREPGIHRLAEVAPDATIASDASIGPFVVIESGACVGARTVVRPHVVIAAGARIGSDCLIHSHVSIRERCILGARVVVQDGAVIGGDGFGFAHRDDGSHEKIPQAAIVVIEDDVEIGANTAIDRPAVGETRIKSGAKIDNLVQIGHGVVIGHNTLLAAQVGIAGSTVVGDDVVLGGQVGVNGHVTIGDRVKAVGQTGITGSVEPDSFVSGYPAIDNLTWRKASAAFKRLPTLRRRLAELEARLAALEAEKHA